MLVQLHFGSVRTTQKRAEVYMNAKDPLELHLDRSPELPWTVKIAGLRKVGQNLIREHIMWHAVHDYRVIKLSWKRGSNLSKEVYPMSVFIWTKMKLVVCCTYVLILTPSDILTSWEREPTLHAFTLATHSKENVHSDKGVTDRTLESFIQGNWERDIFASFPGHRTDELLPACDC